MKEKIFSVLGLVLVTATLLTVSGLLYFNGNDNVTGLAVNSCTETGDNGIDVTKIGTLTVTRTTTPTKKYPDLCTGNGKNVLEYYCGADGFSMGTITYTGCFYGCNNGVCKGSGTGSNPTKPVCKPDVKFCANGKSYSFNSDCVLQAPTDCANGCNITTGVCNLCPRGAYLCKNNNVVYSTDSTCSASQLVTSCVNRCNQIINGDSYRAYCKPDTANTCKNLPIKIDKWGGVSISPTCVGSTRTSGRSFSPDGRCLTTYMRSTTCVKGCNSAIPGECKIDTATTCAGFNFKRDEWGSYNMVPYCSPDKTKLFTSGKYVNSDDGTCTGNPYPINCITGKCINAVAANRPAHCETQTNCPFTVKPTANQWGQYEAERGSQCNPENSDNLVYNYIDQTGKCNQYPGNCYPSGSTCKNVWSPANQTYIANCSRY